MNEDIGVKQDILDKLQEAKDLAKDNEELLTVLEEAEHCANNIK